jgi:hypothetical protein
MAVEQWTDERLDRLAELAERNSLAIERNSLAIEKLTQESERRAQESERSAQESKELNIRFTAYQQASQWVVNLSFGLLATATITTIVTAVFRK